MPSYLSSTHASPPTRRMIAAASSSGDASMNCSGCINRNRADRSSPRRASNATSPRSPVSMLAQDTSESGAPNAFAIPSSTSPARSPMRRSPVRICPMYLASRGVNLSSSSRIASPVRANASMDELALLDLVGGRSGDRFASFVPVEGQRDVLPAALGLDVFDRITVALPDVGVEGVALFVLGRRVPGLSLRQAFLADILLGTGAAECRGIDAGCAFRRLPLRAAWRQTIVCAVERDLFDREGLTADRRLELEVALRLGLVDQGTVAGKRHGGPVIRDLSRHLEVRVLQVGLLRFGQHFLRARRRRRCGNAARSGQEAGRRRQHDEPACQLSPAPLATLAAVRS